MLMVLLLGFMTKLSKNKGWNIIHPIAFVLSVLVFISCLVAFPAIVLFIILYAIGYGLASLIK